MAHLVVRPAALSDALGISAVYAGDDEIPHADPAAAAVWTKGSIEVAMPVRDRPV